MKADGGSLVYIILSLLFIIISAIGKNSKKQAQQNQSQGRQPSQGKPSPMDEPQPMPQRGNWPKELEEIFGNVFTENYETEPEEKPESIPPKEVIPEPRQTYFTYDNIPPVIESQENIEVISDTPHLTKEEEESLLESELQFDVETDARNLRFNLENFDLQKAVIYSEIINRKYF